VMGRPQTAEGVGVTEMPQHEVAISKEFYMGVFEVTQAQHFAVTGLYRSTFRDPLRPVDQIGWRDAMDFCTELQEKVGNQVKGFKVRLPTEAEWEYACRAGATGEVAGTGRLLEMGWYEDNSRGRTQRCGRLKPNAWG